METIEQKTKRYEYLKKELESKMPSVLPAIIVGFTPANNKLLEDMAQEFFQLEKELSIN